MLISQISLTAVAGFLNCFLNRDIDRKGHGDDSDESEEDSEEEQKSRCR